MLKNIERWAFAKGENPKHCHSYDELIAIVNGDVEIIVYRNGMVSNRFGDGIVGISQELSKLAADKEVLYHPEVRRGTYKWRNVISNPHNGKFIRFAPPVRKKSIN